MTGKDMDTLLQRAADLELEANVAEERWLSAVDPEVKAERGREFVAAMHRLRGVENVIERALRNGRD